MPSGRPRFAFPQRRESVRWSGVSINNFVSGQHHSSVKQTFAFPVELPSIQRGEIFGTTRTCPPVHSHSRHCGRTVKPPGRLRFVAVTKTGRFRHLNHTLSRKKSVGVWPGRIEMITHRPVMDPFYNSGNESPRPKKPNSLKSESTRKNRVYSTNACKIVT